jgi:hypothetical protein
MMTPLGFNDNENDHATPHANPGSSVGASLKFPPPSVTSALARLVALVKAGML